MTRIKSIAFGNEVTSNVAEVTVVVDVLYLNFTEALAASQNTLACKMKNGRLYEYSSR